MKGLNFETTMLKNVRDLGGIPTNSGVIKKGRLIRSSALGDAEDSEVKLLAEHYDPRYVIDLRAEDEARKNPDPMHLLPNSEYMNVPLADDKAVGIVRKGGLKEALEMMRTMIDDPRGMMTNMYADIISSERGQQALRQIFDILIDADGETVLWHCTAGKDRAGIVAALILLELGVSRDTVYEDYRLTDKFIGPYLSKQEKQLRFAPKKVKKSLVEMNKANPLFLDEAMRAIDEDFGGIESYMNNQIGLNSEKHMKLRELYVEKLI